MTRSELIQAILAKLDGLSEKQVETAIKSIFDSMGQALEHNQSVEIRGFGRFSVRFRQARQVRNPRTGDYLDKPERYSLHFKPGKEMRERVNAEFLSLAESKIEELV